MIRIKEILNKNIFYSERANVIFIKDIVIGRYKDNFSNVVLFFKELRLIKNEPEYLTTIKILNKQLNLIIISQNQLNLSLLLFPSSPDAFGEFWSKNININIFEQNSPTTHLGKFGQIIIKMNFIDYFFLISFYLLLFYYYINNINYFN